MTKVQWKSGCDNYLLSYEHFYLPNLPSKMGLKKCFLPQQMECRYGPTATVTSLKVTWNEGPDQGIMVKTGKNGCIWAKLVVLGQKWLYSYKGGCIRGKVFVISQSGCIRANLVVIEQK